MGFFVRNSWKFQHASRPIFKRSFYSQSPYFYFYGNILREHFGSDVDIWRPCSVPLVPHIPKTRPDTKDSLCCCCYFNRKWSSKWGIFRPTCSELLNRWIIFLRQSTKGFSSAKEMKNVSGNEKFYHHSSHSFCGFFGAHTSIHSSGNHFFNATSLKGQLAKLLKQEKRNPNLVETRPFPKLKDL